MDTTSLHINWFSALAEQREFWAVVGTLAGTILGFVLNQFSTSFRQWKERRRLKKALFDELETNLFQIDHKKDTLRNMIASLQKETILPGISVPCASAIYTAHFPAVVKHLQPIERDVIQNVYSRLLIDDSIMQNTEQLLKVDLREKIVTHPWESHISKLNDIVEDYEIAQELIKSVLDGNPVDIYQRKSNIPLEQKVFGGKITPDIVRKQRGA
jgi:hypothetical protein